LNKIFVLFGLVFFFGTIFSSIAAGAAGPSTTYLTVPITAGDVTVWVLSTDGFDNSGTITVDNEDLGVQGKTATSFTLDSAALYSHSVYASVYSPGTNVLNAALGFNVGTSMGEGGWLTFPVWGYRLVTVTLPNMITFHYNFLLSGDYQYIRYVFMACSVGFSMFVIYHLVSLFVALASRFFF
jgi:hypothetical protein